jgi:hypothetical protein
MDPDQARRKMIESANVVLALTGGMDADHLEVGAAAIALAESVHAMDGWLRQGGFLPDEWMATSSEAIGRKQAMPEDWGSGTTSRIVDVPDPAGKAVDDQRPRVDGSVCGHVGIDTNGADAVVSSPCVLDRGHEGGHVPA